MAGRWGLFHFTLKHCTYIKCWCLAGCESGAGNPLAADFILVGQKLAKLGFVYNKGVVNVIELDEYTK